MSKSKKILIGFIFILLIGFSLFFLYSKFNNAKVELKQMILIGIDGMQVSRYNELLNMGDLPNFNQIITNGGINSTAIITGHENTSTAPGNAELLTGLNSVFNNINDSSCEKIITPGKTIFERLNNFNSEINLGSIYGKETCYIPLSLLSNAKKIISWWQDSKTYKHKNYITDTCTDSIDVISKSLEFIKENKDRSFFLFIYLGAPDCAGHQFGIPSLEYDESIKNADDSLGILFKSLETFEIKPKIIISGDHGWNSISKNHNIPDKDTLTVSLITNDNKIINGTEEKKQCDITPTILNYFGMGSKEYSDITELGCKSLTQPK